MRPYQTLKQWARKHRQKPKPFDVGKLQPTEQQQTFPNHGPDMELRLVLVHSFRVSRYGLALCLWVHNKVVSTLCLKSLVDYSRSLQSP